MAQHLIDLLLHVPPCLGHTVKGTVGIEITRSEQRLRVKSGGLMTSASPEYGLQFFLMSWQKDSQHLLTS